MIFAKEFSSIYHAIKEDNMNRKDLEQTKEQLLIIKNKILNEGILTSKQDLSISPEELADESDLATQVINQHVSLNMREREFNKIRLIDQALQRIHDGSYGVCEECDEDISKKRLKYQPWTTLCIIHAEEYERKQSRQLV